MNKKLLIGLPVIVFALTACPFERRVKHAGDRDNPYTLEDLVTISKKLKEGDSTQTKIFVKTTVYVDENKTYTTPIVDNYLAYFYIGNSKNNFYVSGANDSNGRARYEIPPVKNGDKVLVAGELQNKNGKCFLAAKDAYLDCRLITVNGAYSIGTLPYYTVSIINKTTFYAPMEAEGESRYIQLELTENGTVRYAGEEYAKGKLKVYNSNPEKVNVRVSGNIFYLDPLEAGITNITFKYDNVSESINITVINPQTAIEKYGTKHLGTLEDPFDNEDAYQVGLWLKNNNVNQTPKEYYIRGIVETFYHSPGSRADGMVACYLKPIEGSNKRFLVYSFYKDSNNTPLTDNDVWNGADITVYGKITYYSPNSQPETSSATLIANHNEPVPRSKIIETTFEEAFEKGKQLESGESSWNLYKFVAYVVYKESDNFFLAATDVSSSANKYDGDTMIELYGLRN